MATLKLRWALIHCITHKARKVSTASMNDPIKTTVTTANKAQPHPLLNKVTDTVGNILSAPARAYYGAKGAVENYQADQKLASRNFKGRTDNTNYYKDTSYWAKNKN